jgi:hypothetical protein
MSARDNGFVARHYVPLADLDPRLADAMLDVLRAESIAAYVEPSTGHMGGYLDVHLPERPRDRLWVDREQHSRAINLLNEHTAGSTEPITADMSGATSGSGGDVPVDSAPDVTTGTAASDDVWAQLVANFDRAPDDVVPRWPAAEDIRPTPGDDDEQPSVRRRVVRPADRAPEPEPVTANAEYGGEYDPLSILDELFIPPTPPPAPALRTPTKWAILAIATGFTLIVVKQFSDIVPGSFALGVIGIVGGFLILVGGMRSDRSDDSDSDDGAVV